MWKCPKCGREFKNTNQDHYCGEVDSTDAYIADQPEEYRDILQKTRMVILKVVPDAVEKIAWRMPTFVFPEPKLKGKYIIHFASFKNHLGIYPGNESIAAFAERLNKDGYKYSKGAIQFPYSKPIPFELISEIARWHAERLRPSESVSGKPTI